jgi:hypothetical protein
MKTCLTCKHYHTHSSTECTAPGNTEINYVSGGLKPRYEQAQSVRVRQDMCGPDATWHVLQEVRRPSAVTAEMSGDPF